MSRTIPAGDTVEHFDPGLKQHRAWESPHVAEREADRLLEGW
jgi:hypothetical protein